MADHQVNPPSGEEVRDPSSSADKAVVQMRTQTSTASDLVQSEMRNSPTEDQSCGFGDRQMQQALQASEESVDSTPGSMKDPITMSDHTLKEVGQNPAPQISVKPAPLQTGRKKGLKAGLKLDLGSSSRFNRKNKYVLALLF
ncbi:hypothetical protein SARC_00006 [Sphaeroforma arctica JP610]|uniref:Uncharacterized protein n=1 Tax=Sphaeroforma arctica JP610 TaxID=667725 RepID=A0A0L0GFT0_9EUKA|nr:hypothetical protein SARC_00006 [Sphaeroforma arctica JP610]KNC87872.1 hypothetical protein SARC_00006 [Sphaeroforma arctica JP610]|eukprot:XP_014161774.1 hypothetical protein SARC_00006 [Sphaeroforma arctica JP610]